MPRILSQTLIRESQALIRSDTPPSCGRSNNSAAGQLIEINLDAEASSATAREAEILGMRRLEDAIHGIIVRRSAPDWLPFIPGSSYWVPPPRRRALGLIELVGKLATPLHEEESLSLTTPLGWPSLAYFVEA